MKQHSSVHQSILFLARFARHPQMTAAVGFPTLRLVRVRVGGLELDGLERGGVREVIEDDIMKGIT